MKRYKVLFVLLTALSSLLPTILFAQMIWTQATSSAGWVRRCEQSCVVFDNKIWIFGGYDGTNRRRDVYNSSDGVSWTCITNNAEWAARNAFSSVVFDNKIWVLGGCNGVTFTNDIWYSTDGIIWTCANASASWSPRACFSSIVFDNKIWIFGGMDPSGFNKNDVWFSSDGINWICATPSAEWSPRYSYSVVVFDNKMWILGGSNVSDVWYSTNGVNWIQATASASWTSRIAHTSVVFDGKMWILGGCDGEHSYRSDVWYSTDGVDWICDDDTAQWCGRWLHSSVVYNNKIWVMAGLVYCVPSSSTCLNDVWYSCGLGIAEEIENCKLKIESFSVYPNPAKTYFTVRLPSALLGEISPLRGGQTANNSSLKLFDVSGKIAKEARIMKQETKISLEGIKPGVYFLQLDNETTTKKLIITK